MIFHLPGGGAYGDELHPFELAPPRLVLAVPADSLREALLEGDSRSPVEACAEARGVGDVFFHLTRTVSDSVEC